MYCTTSPGYPLTSNTVYSPPPRPLPRNTFSRPAFSLKKPYKHCNWKCAALSAILISITLLFLLAYFIGKFRQNLLHSGVATFISSPPIPPSCNCRYRKECTPHCVSSTSLIVLNLHSALYMSVLIYRHSEIDSSPTHLIWNNIIILRLGWLNLHRWASHFLALVNRADLEWIKKTSTIT